MATWRYYVKRSTGAGSKSVVDAEKEKMYITMDGVRLAGKEAL